MHVKKEKTEILSDTEYCNQLALRARRRIGKVVLELSEWPEEYKRQWRLLRSCGELIPANFDNTVVVRNMVIYFSAELTPFTTYEERRKMLSGVCKTCWPRLQADPLEILDDGDRWLIFVTAMVNAMLSVPAYRAVAQEKGMDMRPSLDPWEPRVRDPAKRYVWLRLPKLIKQYLALHPGERPLSLAGLAATASSLLERSARPVPAWLREITTRKTPAKAAA